MKYWTYLNDEVSQQSYSEEELRQLPGFGPDTLICSEVSAVSQNPDWKTVSELLPHLVRPKAPDFSKFRPKPPVAGAQQNNQNPLPIPNVLPVGVTTTPSDQQPQNASVQNINSNNPNQELLAQLESLTAKISSLENKIVEQEKELAAANGELNRPFPAEAGEIHDFGEATFVSEPQNDEEDDVLEVPFDSDFEVPFDTNKTSEEIAQEAEALLANKHSNEMEEYDADDPNADLIPFASSEMQGILEDTIRQTNAFENPYEQNYNRNEANRNETENADTRTFIAQDLISKKTLDLTEQKEKENETSSQVADNKEEPKTAEPETKTTQETITEQTPAEEIKTEENKEQKVNDRQEGTAPATEENKPETQEEVKEDAQEVEEEKTEETTEEKIEEHASENEIAADNLPEQKNTVKETPAEDNVKEPESQVEKEDIVEEQKTVEEENSPKLPTLEDNAEQNLVETPSEVSVSEEPAEESKSEEPINVEPEQKDEDNIQISSSDDNLLVSLEGNNNEDSILSKEELNEDPSDEPMDEYEMTQGFTPEEDKKEDIEDNQNEDQILSMEELKEDPSDEPMDEYEMTQGFTPKYDNIKEQNADKQPIEVEQNNSNGMPVIPGDDSDVMPTNEQEKELDKSPELSMTGIALSNDATTAAVLNEIAQEKSRDIPAVTTTDKLFEELEKTYKEGETSDNPNNSSDEMQNLAAVGSSDSSEENTDSDELSHDEELAKDDEFLKTFTTSVEEVFLDQPTAIISDYVPPSDNTDHGQPVVMDGNIIRKKPSDIKTVPLVPEAMGQEIWSAPYVESATAKVRRSSMVGRLVVFAIAIVLLVIMALAILAGLAVMGVVPEKLSPINAVFSSSQKISDNVVTEEDLDMAPEMIEQENAVQSFADQDNNQPYTIVESVKNYTFSDGTTLEGRIKTSNKVSSDQLEWTLLPTEEQNVYSIAVRLPKNSVGQGFSYRFNYNSFDKVLTPTTSESKNIMENYSR